MNEPQTIKIKKHNIEKLMGVPDTDLFVGDGIGEADTLDLGPGVSRRTGATAEAWGCVDTTYPHVTGLHSALSTETAQEHIKSGAVYWGNYSDLSVIMCVLTNDYVCNYVNHRAILWCIVAKELKF